MIIVSLLLHYCRGLLQLSDDVNSNYYSGVPGNIDIATKTKTFLEVTRGKAEKIPNTATTKNPVYHSVFIMLPSQISWQLTESIHVEKFILGL